jgi:hypothetical protein
MNPIPPVSASPVANAGSADAAAATAATQAQFDQTLSQVLSSVGTSVLSLSLDDLIQISQEDV